ncbi:MAG: biopolymer transporter ExbD [Flavobacteriales bacterium]|jgi:biopolymer transport protein ExbD|nr:biopolymer transporter ExbD [Flavobacteriales bacterium]
MNFRGRNKINPQFNMSSMTDIVFLLLIFFMITSTLVTTSALDIILPKASGKTVNKKNTSITIKKNLRFYLNDNKSSTPEARIASELKASVADLKNPVLVIRAEEGVPIEKVVMVMDIANRNKYKVILAVRPK